MKRAPPLELVPTVYEPNPAKCRPHAHCERAHQCLRRMAVLPERAPVADFQALQSGLGGCTAFIQLPIHSEVP